MSKRPQIIQSALSWVDTPYHHHAQVKGVGVDCAMLVANVAVEADCLPAEAVPTIVDYPIEWHLHNHEEKLIEQIEGMGALRIPNEDAQAGDIVTFKYGRVTSHLGILVTEDEFIHAAKDAGKVVRVYMNGDFLQRWSATFRFPGVDA